MPGALSFDPGFDPASSIARAFRENRSDLNPGGCDPDIRAAIAADRSLREPDFGSGALAGSTPRKPGSPPARASGVVGSTWSVGRRCFASESARGPECFPRLTEAEPPSVEGRASAFRGSSERRHPVERQTPHRAREATFRSAPGEVRAAGGLTLRGDRPRTRPLARRATEPSLPRGGLSARLRENGP